MMKTCQFVLCVVLLGMAPGCKQQAKSGDATAPSKAEKQVEQIPDDPLEFRRYLIKHYPAEMEATLCQCCNKSLRLCYEETLTPGVPSCPDT